MIHLRNPLIRALVSYGGLVLVLVGGAMLVSVVFALVFGLAIAALLLGSWLAGLRRRRERQASPPEDQREAEEKAYEAVRATNFATRIGSPLIAVLIIVYEGFSVATALIAAGFAIIAIVPGPSEQSLKAKLEERREGSEG